MAVLVLGMKRAKLSLERRDLRLRETHRQTEGHTKREIDRESHRVEVGLLRDIEVPWSQAMVNFRRPKQGALKWPITSH